MDIFDLKKRFFVCQTAGQPGAKVLINCFESSCNARFDAEKKCKNSSLPRSYGQKTIFILFCILAYWYEKNFFRMTEILYAQRTIVSDLRKNSGSEHWICYGFGFFLIFFKILHIFFGCRRISRARNFFSTKFFF